MYTKSLFDPTSIIALVLVLLPTTSPLSAKQTNTPSISGVSTGSNNATCINTPVNAANTIPIGPYCATITGANFGTDTAVAVGGRTAIVLSVDSLTQITIAGAGVVPWDGTAQPVVVTSGGVSSLPFFITVGTPNARVSWSAASRFLDQTTFGPTHDDIVRLQTLGFTTWLIGQFRTPQNSPYGTTDLGEYPYYPSRFFFNAASAPDQLRQRVAFSLSQLFVVSADTLGTPENVAPYYNMLYSLSFSNYPTILSAVTISPAMGAYLNMAGNVKASGGPNGTIPSQNFAREVLQLFSIGPVLLDETGTPVTNNGVPVAAYSQTTIGNFARVFTGWNIVDSALISPMVPNNETHDTDITVNPKVLLSVPGGPVLPYQTTTSGDAATELGQALVNIEAHPNVAPFISKFLIQHLVTSNPSPAYVRRVATRFAQTNGDMKTVLMTILLDSEARAGDSNVDGNPSFGHLREPALWLTGLCRSLNSTVTDLSNALPNYSATLGEPMFYSPSVFNFYAPTYALPASFGLQPGLLAPEFQIQSPSEAYQRVWIAATSTLTGGLWSSTFSSPDGYVDLSPYVNLSSEPDLLVDALDAMLTHGQMPTSLKTLLLGAIQTTPPPIQQTTLAIYLLATSSYYQVIH